MADNTTKFSYLQFDMNVEEFSKAFLDQIKLIPPLKFQSTYYESGLPMLYTSHNGAVPLVEESPISFSMHLVPLLHVNLDYLRSSQLEEIKNLMQKRMTEDIDNSIRKYLMGD